MKKLSRRNFIATSSVFAVSAVFCKRVSSDVGGGDGHIEVQGGSIAVDRHVVLHADERFNTLPSIDKLPNGKTIVVFRQAPDWQYRYGVTDIDHDSSVVSLTADQGEFWDNETATEVYANFLHGVDRPGIKVLRDGTLFCTYVLWQVDVKTSENENTGTPVFDKWVGRIRSSFSLRSTNGGETWDSPVEIPTTNPLGQECVELADGSILCADYNENITIFKTTNGGKKWQTLATINRPTDYDLTDPVLYQTDSGKIVCYANGVPKSADKQDTRLISAESSDNGATWSNSVIRNVKYLGSPHLLRVNNNHVLLTYKYYDSTKSEIRAALLNADCSDVDDVDHIVLRSTDAAHYSGSTSAALIAANKLLVVYANSDVQGGKRYIAGTVCNINN